MKKKILFVLLALGCAAVVGTTFRPQIHWMAKQVHRVIFSERLAEGPVYERTAAAAFDLADFVDDSRKAWPGASTAIVHGAALDVAAGLLFHPDIEVGSILDGAFVSWRLAPWKAAERIRHEIGNGPGYFGDRGRYVFRRKVTP